jgi:uncharacterized membrane protein YqjE
MGNLLSALIFFLFILSYAILIVPALIVLVIADVIKGNRCIKMFDTNILQKLEA